MWLTKQKREVLEDWVRRTKTPMLSTLPDGTILWTNEAFERFLGYTSAELAGEKTWVELTRQDDDLEFDQQMVADVVAGHQTDYQLRKHYQQKSGQYRECVIDVMRYPLQGEFEFFLVAVVPVDVGVELAISQLGQIRKLILEMMSREPAGLTFNKFWGWATKNKLVASIIGVILAFLLFGERVFEILQLFGVGNQGGE